MQSFLKFADVLSEWSGKIISWLIIGLVGALVFEVVARYVFNRPTTWAWATSFILCGTHFMIGAAYTLHHKGHVKMDILYNRLSAYWQAIVDVLLYIVVFFPVVFLLMLGGIEFTERSWALGEKTTCIARIPLPFFRLMLPIGMLLLLITGMAGFIRALAIIRRGK